LKPAIHAGRTIGLKPEIDVFVALDFNKDKLLGVFFWVCEVRDPQRGTFFLVVLKLFKISIIVEILERHAALPRRAWFHRGSIIVDVESRLYFLRRVIIIMCM
jgi:hypothetical protein